ncbi:hypothetical protein GCM10010253_57980 [Streptomyces badius]|uniref:Uncharacterized protein n=1 Tax=Streptomyces badius TaxID=1941 RepID=A0ABQ2TKQ4_STRBA|nr:hypothetical protein GCM10010253_57980 [Streptomyces badius]
MVGSDPMALLLGSGGLRIPTDHAARRSPGAIGVAIPANLPDRCVLGDQDLVPVAGMSPGQAPACLVGDYGAARVAGRQPSSVATVMSAGTDSSVDSRMESRANRSATR